MEPEIQILFVMLVYLLTLFAIVAFCSFIIKICWNAFMPDVFNLPRINMNKAFVIYIVLNFIFGMLRS